MSKPDPEMLAEYHDGVVSMLGNATIEQHKQALVKGLRITPAQASRTLDTIITDDLYDTEMQDAEPFRPEALRMALERLVQDHIGTQGKDGGRTR